MAYNERDGTMQSGGRQIATVVSIGKGETDKSKQDGRVQVRFTSQQESGIASEQLVWCQVEQSTNNGGFRDVGDSIGHNLVPGTTVVLHPLGQQQFTVGSVLRNENKDKNVADANFSPHKRKTKQEDFNKKYSKYDGLLTNVPATDASTANFGTVNFNPQKGDPIDDIGKTVKQALRFGNKTGLKSVIDKYTPNSLANFARFHGNLSNTTKAVKELLGKPGELIAGSLDMSLKLQQAAKAGTVKSAASMVGGADKWAKALSVISSMLNAAASPNNPPDEEDQLCVLYTEITGLPCKIDNEYTKEFLLWKAAYLIAYEATGGFEDV